MINIRSISLYVFCIIFCGGQCMSSTYGMDMKPFVRKLSEVSEPLLDQYGKVPTQGKFVTGMLVGMTSARFTIKTATRAFKLITAGFFMWVDFWQYNVGDTSVDLFITIFVMESANTFTYYFIAVPRWCMQVGWYEMTYWQKKMKKC